MHLTEQAGRAIVLAAETARSLGADQIGGYHLLLALADSPGGAGPALGTSAQRLHDAAAALFPPKPRRPDRAETRLGADAQEALDRGFRAARAAGNDRMTTVDLLRALLDLDGGVAASVLRRAGVDPAAVRAALVERDEENGGESGVSEVRPILTDMGSRAARVPGRARGVLNLLGNLVPYALLYAAALAVTWDTAGPELVLTVAVAVMLILGLVAPLDIRRRIRRLTANGPTGVLVPDEFRPMLDRLGLRSLEVRVRPATADHCLRLARRAWIVISAHTERQVDLLPFVLWHEVAHLARRDIRVRRVTAIVGFGLLMASLVSFDPRAMVIAWVGVPVVGVAGRWWSEAACDRLAVEHAGTHALHRWAADVRANRGARRVSRVRAFLSHPPLALRTALHP